MIDRRLVFNLDWVFLGAVLLLAGIGVATIGSATQSGRLSGLYLKQVYIIGLGLLAMLVSLAIDYRRLADRAVVIYVASVLVLLYVLRFSPVIAGTRRWILVGSFQLQPSEFVKIAAALFVAKVFAESRHETMGLRDIAGPGAAVGLLVFLIAREPDLGTAACLVPLFLAVAFLAGLRMRSVASLVVAMLLVAGLAWHVALRTTRSRASTPSSTPTSTPAARATRRSSRRSRWARAGSPGKGVQAGEPEPARLPARAAHRLHLLGAGRGDGVPGVAAVLGLYLLVIWRMLETARLARDRVGAFLAAAIAATFTFQVVYNVAMVAGLVPVKGLPLPLMSYGGSSVSTHRRGGSRPERPHEKVRELGDGRKRITMSRGTVARATGFRLRPLSPGKSLLAPAASAPRARRFLESARRAVPVPSSAHAARHGLAAAAGVAPRVAGGRRGVRRRGSARSREASVVQAW